MDKLQKLCDVTGRTDEELFEEGTFDGVCEGICTNPDCGFTATVEPDCQQGWCDECDTATVSSALILAGMI